MKKIIKIILSIILSFNKLNYSMNKNKVINMKDIDKLVNAIRVGNLDKVKFLINKGIEINFKDYCGWSFLIFAIEANKKEIVQFLIEKGIDINNVAENDQTPIMWAAQSGQKEIVKMLADRQVLLNCQNIWGETALMMTLNCTSSNFYKEVMEILIDAGADINLKNKKNKTIFKLVSDRNLIDLVGLFKNIVLKWKKEVYQAINNNDYINFKKYILKIGSICFKDENGNNLLHYTLKNQNLEMFKYIYLINPQLIELKNNLGKTPLELVMQHPDSKFFSFISALSNITNNI